MRVDRLFFVVLLLLTAIAVPGHRVHAQSLEPRSYANTPVGINFVLLVRLGQAPERRDQSLVLQTGGRNLEGNRTMDAGRHRGSNVLYSQRRFFRWQQACPGPALFAAGTRDLQLPLRDLGFARRHVLRRRPNYRQRRAEQRPSTELARRRDLGVSGGPREFDQVLRQQRGGGAHRRQLRPGRRSVAISLWQWIVMPSREHTRQFQQWSDALSCRVLRSAPPCCDNIAHP